MPRWPSRRAVRGRERRWPRRLLIGGISLLVVVVLLIVGVFFYARYRFNQIHKARVTGLTPTAPGKPFDILLVGSDSRAFVDTPGEASAFGAKSATSGQRSDVIIIARIDPVAREVRLLSIPRDTWVDIPGDVADISGPNRINAAYNSGPSLLVETIKDTFHIPVTYYAEVNFPGFSGMVNALGGVYLDFRYPVRDAYSGLDITTTGCQLVHGTQALALVRSRHLYYFEGGAWQYDGLSDFSRIQRQDAFFRAIVSRLRGAVTNPLTLNSFLGAATKNVTIDQTLSEGELVNLAKIFRSFTSAELVTQTMPTAPATISGQDVLIPATAADETLVSSFLAFGASSASTTAAIRSAPGDASGIERSPGLAPALERPAGQTPAGLTSAVRNSVVPTSAVLTSAVPTSAVPTSTVPTASDTVPVTTAPGSPTVSPGSVVYNLQAEPWNPVPCSP